MISIYLKNNLDVIGILDNPAFINIKTPSRVYQSLSIADIGDIQRILNERTLKEVSFSSCFFKENAALNNGAIHNAFEITKKIEAWRGLDSPIRLIVTGEWELNMRCTITEFSFDVKGLGNAEYSIAFKEFPEYQTRKLTSVAENNSSYLTTQLPDVITPKPVSKTYVVKSGDNLTKISQTFLGNGHRWPDIWNLNKDIVKNPNLIYPGQVLKMPEQ